MKIGDKVVFHYWSGDELHSAPATVTGFPGHEALELEVNFPEGVAEAEGFTRNQSWSEPRHPLMGDQQASGTWSPA